MKKASYFYTFWFVPNVFNEGAFFLSHRLSGQESPSY